MLTFTHDQKWEIYLAMAIMGIGLGLAFSAIRRDPLTHHEDDVALWHAELSMVAGGTVVGDEPE
jgi:hypothetical protein